MPVTDFGSDWNRPYRMPPGWTTLPDGSVGPSSAVPDWLKQLIPVPGASVPNAPGGAMGPYSGGPQGFMPGGGVMDRQAVTSGAPSMGFPAQATIDPAQLGGGGGFNPLAMFGNINPYARAAIAAAGVMQPTATAADQAPTNMWMQRPSGVGGMPGPQVQNYMPSRPYSPTPQNYPSWPTVGPGGSSGVADAPTGSPSATPRPARPFTPTPKTAYAPTPKTAAAPASAANPRFGLYQSQVPGSGRGPLSSNPIYTTLNLADLFKGRRS
jgi:hypothetical protein